MTKTFFDLLSPTPITYFYFAVLIIWGCKSLIGLMHKRSSSLNWDFTVSIVIPVYNENPDYFYNTLRSLSQENPHEIIAVIDHSDERSINVFKEFCKEFPQSKLLITRKPGKRPALVDGILEASGDLVALVDSDVIWQSGTLAKALPSFADPDIGGVCPRCKVLNPQNLPTQLYEIFLEMHNIIDLRFLAATGNALDYVNGQTGIYRRTALLPLLDDLLGETFFGKPVISGENHSLTNLLQATDWKICYQEDIQVYVRTTTVMKNFIRMRLRLHRNIWRSNIKVLGSYWSWKHPILIAHLAICFFEPFIQLLLFMFIVNSMFLQPIWGISQAITWSLVLYAVKVFPILSERRFTNLPILLFYIPFSWWDSVLQIYAFHTMNYQGWITRWNQSRMRLAGPLRGAYAYISLAVVMTLLAVFALWLQTSVLW